MPIIAAAKLGFFNYVNYKGRAHRADFWWWTLFAVLSQFLISRASLVIGGYYFLALLLPSIMFSIRRMHDVDRSGWWNICPFLVPLYFLVQPGDAGINRFGPPAPPTNF